MVTGKLQRKAVKVTGKNSNKLTSIVCLTSGKHGFIPTGLLKISPFYFRFHELIGRIFGIIGVHYGE